MEEEEKEENSSADDFEEEPHLDDGADEQDSDDGEEQLESEEGDDIGDNYDDYGLSSYDDPTDVSSSSSVSSCPDVEFVTKITHDILCVIYFWAGVKFSRINSKNYPFCEIFSGKISFFEKLTGFTPDLANSTSPPVHLPS